jgi:hypothetical protein
MSAKKTVSRDEWEKKCADVKLSKSYPKISIRDESAHKIKINIDKYIEI